MLRVDVAPGLVWRAIWSPIITGTAAQRDAGAGRAATDVLAQDGLLMRWDIFMDQDYGHSGTGSSRTYGFIHSERVIDHIEAQGITSIRWKFRARFYASGP